MAANPFQPRIFETEAEYLRSVNGEVAVPLRDVVRIMVDYYERHGLDVVEKLRNIVNLERYRGGGRAPADLEKRTILAERWPQRLLDWWRVTRTAAGVNDAVLCREIVTNYSLVSTTNPEVLAEVLRLLAR